MIKCTRFRAFSKDSLKGFADFELSRIGLILRDCTWHESNGKEWISFAARSYTTQDGTTSWTPLVEFSREAKQARAEFQRQALAAVRAVAATAVSS